MRNTVPLSSVVPLSRSPSSAVPVLSTGKPWLVQTTQAWAPGRAERRFCDTSSIVAIARPELSCPVTTRRTRSAIGSPPLVDRGQEPHHAARKPSPAPPSLPRLRGREGWGYRERGLTTRRRRRCAAPPAEASLRRPPRPRR